jgi:hypothetical protein
VRGFVSRTINQEQTMNQEIAPRTVVSHRVRAGAQSRTVNLCGTHEAAWQNSRDELPGWAYQLGLGGEYLGVRKGAHRGFCAACDIDECTDAFEAMTLDQLVTAVAASGEYTGLEIGAMSLDELRSAARHAASH